MLHVWQLVGVFYYPGELWMALGLWCTLSWEVYETLPWAQFGMIWFCGEVLEVVAAQVGYLHCHWVGGEFVESLDARCFVAVLVFVCLV